MQQPLDEENKEKPDKKGNVENGKPDRQKNEVQMGLMPSHKEELLLMLSDSSSGVELETRGGLWEYKTAGALDEDEKELRVWTTYYGLNSMSKAVATTCGLDAGKSPFMREKSEFWISNRVANLASGGLDRDLRRVKNWELKILVELQEDLLAK